MPDYQEIYRTQAATYDLLVSREDHQGNLFPRVRIRTDYRFESLAEAEDLMRLFFGDTLADRVASEGLVILPECTGIWWLTV
jgi:hypothetical protein